MVLHEVGAYWAVESQNDSKYATIETQTFSSALVRMTTGCTVAQYSVLFSSKYFQMILLHLKYQMGCAAEGQMKQMPENIDCLELLCLWSGLVFFF